MNGTAESSAWLEVDLDAIYRNAERLHAAAAAPLIAMIKADGYGLGAVAVARRLTALGKRLWGFGVGALDEAAALRDAGVTARLFCCTPLPPDAFARASRLRVEPSLHRPDDIAAWARTAQPWHLAIDTGMSRTGVRWDDAAALRDTLAKTPPPAVFMHYSSAPDSVPMQDARFGQALAALADMLPHEVIVHSDNSAGIAAHASDAPASHAQASDAPASDAAQTRVTRKARHASGAARPGIGLYGAIPLAPVRSEPVLALRARVIDLRTVRDGDTVSYDATWVARGARDIATIAVGYGDGYRRSLSNRGEGLLHGRQVAIAGRVTMDMTMFDVTGHACTIGDVITLIGRDVSQASWNGMSTMSNSRSTPSPSDRASVGSVLTVGEVADAANVSPYELLVGLRLRLPRVYVSSSQPESA